MFSRSTSITPRGSFKVACEKIGDHLGSGIISGRVQISAYQREAKGTCQGYQSAFRKNFFDADIQISET